MTEIEAIRAAFAAIADEAPAPERIRSTLSGRVRADRRRRLLLTAGGLVTAGAAAGFTGYMVTRDRPEPPPADDAPAEGWMRIPFGYGPAWLPDDLSLYELGAIVEDGDIRTVSRNWRIPTPLYTYGQKRELELRVGNHWLYSRRADDGAKSFDINGVEGKFKIRGFRSPLDPGLPVVSERWGDLQWDPTDGPPLVLRFHGDGSYDEDDPAVRAARSVRPAAGSFPVHPRFGWLPDRFVGGPWWIRIGVHTDGWFQEVTAYPKEKPTTNEPARGITVQMGTVEPNERHWENSRPQTVRGIEGRYLPGFLRFVQPDGVKVGVYGLRTEAADNAPPPPDLLRVAETFEFGDWPDLSWAGTR